MIAAIGTSSQKCDKTPHSTSKIHPLGVSTTEPIKARVGMTVIRKFLSRLLSSLLSTLGCPCVRSYNCNTSQIARGRVVERCTLVESWGPFDMTIFNTLLVVFAWMTATNAAWDKKVYLSPAHDATVQVHFGILSTAQIARKVLRVHEMKTKHAACGINYRYANGVGVDPFKFNEE